MTASSRRRFLATTAAGGALAGLGDFSFLSGLPAVNAAEARPRPESVEFRPEIEPLVRLMEDTPRNRVLEEVAARIRGGTSYTEVLAALLLAGVRNVQPRPSVGFKFHAVLVVNSAHLASMASPASDRWLPIFWAIDEFKASQASDVSEGDWTMAAVDEAAVPAAHKAEAAFLEAMHGWDVAAADAAVAALARSAGANRVFELFARLGCRDFRSIGHKAIYVANSWRTLQCIGWQHAEPVLRSLAYALLNHNGEPNPSTSDLGPDKPWRRNQELVSSIREDWLSGQVDDSATRDLLSTLHSGSEEDGPKQVVEMLNAGVSPQSIHDALLCGAGEILMRQPGIIGLHAVTTTNALRFAWGTCADDETRRLLMLQNAAFLPMFREAAAGRGSISDAKLTELAPEAAADSTVEAIFEDVSTNRKMAARRVLGYLQHGNSAEEFAIAARRLIFLKGTNAHDYKFSSAALEDYLSMSPEWRDRYLATSVFNLRGSRDGDNGLVSRIRAATDA